MRRAGRREGGRAHPAAPPRSALLGAPAAPSWVLQQRPLGCSSSALLGAQAAPSSVHQQRPLGCSSSAILGAQAAPSWVLQQRPLGCSSSALLGVQAALALHVPFSSRISTNFRCWSIDLLVLTGFSYKLPAGCRLPCRRARMRSRGPAYECGGLSARIEGEAPTDHELGEARLADDDDFGEVVLVDLERLRDA